MGEQFCCFAAEISDDDVSSFFSSFGEVLSVKRSRYDGFPALYDGNRVVKIALDNEVPYFVRVHDFPCRAWYAGQPPQCSVCRTFFHRAPDCPLSGLCRRWHQRGHLARECLLGRRGALFIWHRCSCWWSSRS